MLLELLLSIIDELVSLILKVNHTLHSLISLLGALSLLDHAVDVGVRETTAGADGDLLLLASGLVLGRDVHDTVSIDVKSDLDLRNTTGSHGNTLKIEVTELFVILGELTLTLKDGDTNLSLVVSGSGEHLALLGWDGRVSGDQPSEDTAHGLNTKRKRSNIKEEDILDIASKDGALDGSTDCNGFIRVHTSVRLLAEEVLDSLTDLGNTAGATNHENFVDASLGQIRVLEAGFEGLECAVYKLLN